MYIAQGNHLGNGNLYPKSKLIYLEFNALISKTYFQVGVFKTWVPKLKVSISTPQN